jgi:cytochrome c biogenesis protein CcmG, thiol:disulfide interchange protein DsbE
MASAESPEVPTTTATGTSQRAEIPTAQRWTHIALALAIALSIIGAAWFVGDRQGWATIGGGGVNATLLPRVGEPAPELFTLHVDGSPVLLSQLRGQPVWINFWGSWCPPCRTEMPDIDRAYETLAPQGLTVLSVAMQEAPEDAVRYATSVGARMPIYVDPSRVAAMIDPEQQPELAAMMASMTKDWQIANFPTHVFIDADGIVRAVVLSQMTYEEALGYGEMVLYPDRQSRTEDANQ